MINQPFKPIVVNADAKRLEFYAELWVVLDGIVHGSIRPDCLEAVQLVKKVTSFEAEEQARSGMAYRFNLYGGMDSCK